MTNKELVEACLALHHSYYEQYRDRRAIEWRIHLALWTILAVLVYFCVSNHYQIGHCAASFVFFAVPLHLVWIVKNVRTQIAHQNACYMYAFQAKMVFKDEAPDFALREADYAKEPDFRDTSPWMVKSFTKYDWWIFVKLGTTIFLCVSVWFLITRIPPQVGGTSQ